MPRDAEQGPPNARPKPKPTVAFKIVARGDWNDQCEQTAPLSGTANRR
jgi:hypothetical protein